MTCTDCSQYRFTKLFEDAEALFKADTYNTNTDQSPFLSLFNSMATCHSLRLVDSELIGDPLDLKMFEFTGWAFEEGEGRNSQNSTAQDPRNPDSGRNSGLSPSIVRPRESSSPSNSVCRSTPPNPPFLANPRRALVRN